MEYRKNRHILKILFTAILFNFLSIPALSNDTDKVSASQDPFELYNRPMFEFNNVVDKALVRPLAVTYATFIPETIKTRVTSFFDLWSYPLDAINYAIQGNWNDSKEALLKFGVSFVITAGTSDAGEYVGTPNYKSTSFNATLARLGFEQGPYIVLPFIGHGSSRNMTSRLVTTASDPLRNISSDNRLTYLKIIDKRSHFITTDESLENTSLDFYAVIRSITLQNEKRLTNGEQSTPSNLNSINFDESDEDIGL